MKELLMMQRTGGWLNIFISPYPLGMFQEPPDWLIDNRRMQRLIELSKTEIEVLSPNLDVNYTGNLPFNSGQLTSRSIILRQIKDVAFNSITVELFSDGRAKIFIPLEYIPKWQLDDIKQLKSEKAKHTIRGLWQSHYENASFELLNFFDIEKLWSAIGLLISFYQLWLKEEYPDVSPHVTNFDIALKLQNVWRSVPFSDSDEWGNQVQEFGLPIMHHDTVKIPRNANKELRLKLKGEMPFWLLLAAYTWGEFGLPLELRDKISASVGVKAKS